MYVKVRGNDVVIVNTEAPAEVCKLVIECNDREKAMALGLDLLSALIKHGKAPGEIKK